MIQPVNVPDRPQPEVKPLQEAPRTETGEIKR